MATAQIRAMGTVGGNLCQRPWCWYFRHPQFPCLKRGGRQCFALPGNNRTYFSVLGLGRLRHVAPLGPGARADGAGRARRDRGAGGATRGADRSVLSRAAQPERDRARPRGDPRRASRCPRPGRRAERLPQAPRAELVGLRPLRGRGVGHAGSRALGRACASRWAASPRTPYRATAAEAVLAGQAPTESLHRARRPRPALGRARPLAHERLQDRPDDARSCSRPHGRWCAGSGLTWRWRDKFSGASLRAVAALLGVVTAVVFVLLHFSGDPCLYPADARGEQPSSAPRSAQRTASIGRCRSSTSRYLGRLAQGDFGAVVLVPDARAPGRARAAARHARADRSPRWRSRVLVALPAGGARRRAAGHAASTGRSWACAARPVGADLLARHGDDPAARRAASTCSRSRAAARSPTS